MLTINCITTVHNSDRQKLARERWDGYDLHFHISPDWRDFPCLGFERVWGLNCCTFGHASLWQKLGSEDASLWHVIVEDDAYPLEHFREVVTVLQSNSEHNIIKLHHLDTRCTVGLLASSEANWISTAAYMIRNPRELLKKIGHPAIDWQLYKTFKAACVYPVCCGQDGPSSIRY